MKDVLFYNGGTNNINFYTFNLNLLSETLAKLMTIVEGKKYITQIFKSKQFGEMPKTELGKQVFTPTFNFAHVIVEDDKSDINYMDYYQYGMNAYTFLLAYHLDRDIGFVLHQDSAKDELSEEMTFKSNDYNTSMFTKIPEQFYYVVDFVNYVIVRRVASIHEELTPEFLEECLNQYLDSYLEHVREVKIKKLQEKMDELDQKMFELEQKQHIYENLNKKKSRTK